MKKIISILLTFTMLLGITLSLPMSVSAVTTDTVSSGIEYYHDENGLWIYELINNGTAYRIASFHSSSYNGYIDVLEIPNVFNALPVTEIGNQAFSNCKNIFKIVIPDSVTIIGFSAFERCSSLSSIVIPNSVTTIEKRTFSECINLTSIVIPNSVTTIRRSAFSRCTNLASVVISNSVTTIEEDTFSQCINLTSIVIPNSVTNIYPYAFINCTSLSDVYYTGSTYEWGRISKKFGNDCLINANIHFNAQIKNNEYGTYIYKLNYSGDGYIIADYIIEDYMVEITNIEIPRAINNIPVVEIGKYAFVDCRNLTSIVIPNSIICIAENAFSGCYNLSKVCYTGSETEWMNVFICYGNDYLTKSNIHYNIEIMTDEYGKWIYKLNDFGDSYIIIDCKGSVTHVEIPRAINNIPVVGIGKYAFSDYLNFNSVTIPDSIIFIEENAFRCHKIYYSGSENEWNNISIHSENDFLTYSKIYYNTLIMMDSYGTWLYELDASGNGYIITEYEGSVTHVEIPCAINDIPVVGIGRTVCYYTENIISITIPSSIAYIDDDAFSGCWNLSRVYYEGSKTDWINLATNCFEHKYSLALYYNIIRFTDYQGMWIFETTDTGDALTVAGYLGNNSQVNIPASAYNMPVVEIGQNSFEDYNMLTNITIPSSVTSIGRDAFFRCSNLTGIEIPYGVTTIDYSTFYGCSNLTSVTIPNSVTEIYTSAFYECTSLTSITIPASVKTIDDTVFMGCTNLTSITLSDGITEIRDEVFRDCKNLTSIIIPNSVTSMGNGVFDGCSKLISVTLSDNIKAIGYYAFDGCGSLASITIPNGVTEINGSAFKDCYKLTSVTIPNSVTRIGDDVFSLCNSLTSVTLPDSVTTIGEDVFSYCSKLNNITVSPDNPNYSSLEGVLFNKTKTNLICYPQNKSSDIYVIPDGVTTISDKAFYYCENLTSVIIPESVTTFGDNVFYYCKGLTSIAIPDSVTTISDSLFYHCDNLTSVTLPESITVIEDDAFFCCKSLTNIILPKKITAIGSYAFSGCSSLTSIVLPDSITDIRENLFYNCAKLTHVTIPDSVTIIGSSAFEDCSNLTSVTIPDSVVSIGSWAFADCTSLASITLPYKVTVIGEKVFFNCTSLNSVTLPENITDIGDYAFNGCSNLTCITLPESITTIGEYTFDNCTSLTDVYYTGNESQWSSVVINKDNSPIKNAVLHYITIPQVSGDVSGDGILSVSDVIYILKYVVGKADLTEKQFARADVSGDGKLNVLDAILIQRLILELA